MSKILIQLYVPAIGLRTDALIPSSIRVEEVTPLLTRAIDDASHGFYDPTGSEVVCVARLGQVLIPGTDVSHYGLMTGDELVII